MTETAQQAEVRASLFPAYEPHTAMQVVGLLRLMATSQPNVGKSSRDHWAWQAADFIAAAQPRQMEGGVPAYPSAAVGALEGYRQLLDGEGERVGVSRQALEEVLAYAANVAAALANQNAGADAGEGRQWKRLEHPLGIISPPVDFYLAEVAAFEKAHPFISHEKARDADGKISDWGRIRYHHSHVDAAFDGWVMGRFATIPVEPAAMLAASPAAQPQADRVAAAEGVADAVHGALWKADARVAELEAEVARLREALAPFAKAHGIVARLDASDDRWPDHATLDWDGDTVGFAEHVTVGDLRRARAALADRTGEQA